MPRIFVPGPSVRPNFGSPQGFINSIDDTIQGFGDRRVAAEEAAATKLFRDQTLAQADRKQDFAEKAGERARAEKLFTREQDNKRALAEQAVIEGSGGSFIEPFLANPETQAFFTSQGITDAAEQRKIVDQLAKDEKSLFNDPTKLGDQVYKGVLDGGGTQAEATAARTRAISGSFTTLPTDLAKAMLVKQTTGTGKSSIFGGSKKAGGGSTTPLSSIPGQKDTKTLRDEFIDTYDVEGGRLTIPGTSIRFTDVFDHDVTKDDVIALEGEFATELRPATIFQTLGSLMESGDGTAKFDIRKGRMTKQQRADFLAVGQAIEAKSNEARGGGILGANATLADIQAYEKAQFDQTNAFNRDILSRTAPQAADFASRLSALQSSQGIAAPQIDPRQGGNQGGAPVVAPEVVAPAESTGSTGLDALLAPAPAPVVQEAEGAPPGRGDKIFAESAPIPIEAIESPELQAQLAEAQQRISIFGNGTPSDKKLIEDTNAELKLRQDETRINEITAELQEMPRPDQRTLAQTAYARSLEKELRDLK